MPNRGATIGNLSVCLSVCHIEKVKNIVEFFFIPVILAFEPVRRQTIPKETRLVCCIETVKYIFFVVLYPYHSSFSARPELHISKINSTLWTLNRGWWGKVAIFGQYLVSSSKLYQIWPLLISTGHYVLFRTVILCLRTMSDRDRYFSIQDWKAIIWKNVAA